MNSPLNYIEMNGRVYFRILTETTSYASKRGKVRNGAGIIQMLYLLARHSGRLTHFLFQPFKAKQCLKGQLISE